MSLVCKLKEEVYKTRFFTFRVKISNYSRKQKFPWIVKNLRPPTKGTNIGMGYRIPALWIQTPGNNHITNAIDTNPNYQFNGRNFTFAFLM